MEFENLCYPFSTDYFLSGEGHKVCYYDSGGRGKPVLFFIHGLGSYIPAWKEVIPALTERFRCIAPDLPGYGKSSKTIEVPSPENYARIITELADHLRINNYSICGHSMGGMVALQAALDYPDRVKSLILVAPAGLEEFTPEETDLVVNYVNPESIINNSEEGIRKNHLFSFYEYKESLQFLIDDRIAIRTASDFIQHTHIISSSVELMLRNPVTQRLNELRIPVTVVFGENDNLIPNKFLHPRITTAEIGMLAVNMIPGSELKMIPECGHYIPLEQPEILSDIIIKHFRF